MTQMHEAIEFARGYIQAEPGMPARRAIALAKSLNAPSNASLIGFCAGLAAHGAVAYFQSQQDPRSARAAGKALLPAAKALGVLLERGGQEEFSLGMSSCMRTVVFSTLDQSPEGGHLEIRKRLAMSIVDALGEMGGWNHSIVVGNMSPHEAHAGLSSGDPRHKFFSLGWRGLSVLIEAQTLARQTPPSASRAPSKPHL